MSTRLYCSKGCEQVNQGLRWHNTQKLGWVLVGPTGTRSDNPLLPATTGKSTLCVHHATSPDISDTLPRFWELEDVSTPCPMTREDAACEEHFRMTHRRDSSGRYVVRLPWNPAIPRELGESRATTVSTLRRLEHRFVRLPDLKVQYTNFMNDYEQLGHMERVHEDSHPAELSYYLPHHTVIKDTSTTTKLRVVFNASQPTSNNRSLKDCLLTGPKLQQDLTTILTRWRKHEFVFTADIAKMYRQILIHPADRDLQRIVWRDGTTQQYLTDYRLHTVTYGTASAPYLAIRTLLQLAEDERTECPLGAAVLEQDTYVDDILSGGSDLPTAHAMKSQLRLLLMAGGFELRKWTSNHPVLLADIPEEHRETLQARPLCDVRIRKDSCAR